MVCPTYNDVEEKNTSIDSSINEKIWGHYRKYRDVAEITKTFGINYSEDEHAAADKPPYELNSMRDTLYSNKNSFGSEHVLTMFTQQWVGIRQACGALSGNKIAIDGQKCFDSFDLRALFLDIAKIGAKKIVYHGMASSTSAILRGVKKMDPNIEIYGVWHGTMAGWSSAEEINLLKEFLALADDGIFERIAFLRKGMHHLHRRAYKRILYNIPPNLVNNRSDVAFSKKPINCVFPSWNNIWKNMYTNILAAQNSNQVSKIYVYSDPAIKIFDKVRHIEFKNHERHYSRLSNIDLCLNISINDCQPMAELEGLSVGTPSLRNDWNLDLETQSRYEDFFTVKSYLDPDAITSKIDELCQISPDTIAVTIKDHVDILMLSSRKRYDDFLEIDGH